MPIEGLVDSKWSDEEQDILFSVAANQYYNVGLVKSVTEALLEKGFNRLESEVGIELGTQINKFVLYVEIAYSIQWYEAIAIYQYIYEIMTYCEE